VDEHRRPDDTATAAPTTGLLSRRSVLAGGSLMALALAAGVDLTSCTSSTKHANPVLTDHEHAVIEAATWRLVPGPQDDPAEAGHPGAREAKAADYIVMLLGALGTDPADVYAGGPFSDRAGNKSDDMADFLPLSNATEAHWRQRLTDLATAYKDGVKQLDQLAGGDFTKASKDAQDAALTKNPKVAKLPTDNTGFTDLLFQHTIEGCFAVPEYGGNASTVMWKEIKFPGDVQPRGYTADEVTNPDPPDPYTPGPMVTDLLNLLTSTAPGSPAPPAIVAKGER
jgi:hypothetical protein